MTISDLFPLGELPLKDGEHLTSLAASLVQVCIDEMQHRESVLSARKTNAGAGGSGSKIAKDKPKPRTAQYSDNAVLAKVFVRAETARRDILTSGSVGVVYLARVVMPNSNGRQHRDWERAA